LLTIQKQLFTEPAKIAVEKADKMKKYILKLSLLCLALFCVCMSGCTDDIKKEDNKLSVVAVNFPCYDFARAVCNGRAEVKMIIPPGAEVHGYEPSLSDIKSIENADIFIYIGGESDVWVEKILRAIDKKELKVVSLMDTPNLTLYQDCSQNFTTENHNHNHSHEHGHGGESFDEHIWTSPKNAIKIVNYIGEVLAETDPENKDIYISNAGEYAKNLSLIDKELETTIKNSKNNFIAVADRFPFVYMANDYHLRYIAAFSGCSPESDAGPKTIVAMIEEMEHHMLDKVFYIELSNQKMASAISEHTGAEKLLLHSCQNVTKEEFEKGITYADLMLQNINNLKEALN